MKKSDDLNSIKSLNTQLVNAIKSKKCKEMEKLTQLLHKNVDKNVIYSAINSNEPIIIGYISGVICAAQNAFMPII